MMKCEDMLIIEMKRLAGAGERINTDLPLTDRAFCALLDRFATKLVTPAERALLDKLRKQDD